MAEKAKNTPKKKKPFVPMEIAKVPLNPDQAVLSCCSQPGRGPQEGFGWQCEFLVEGCKSDSNALSQSIAS